MRYALIMKQDGEGCDYTIGCGTRAEFIEADDMVAAMGISRRRMMEDGGALLSGENEVKTLVVAEVVADLSGYLPEWRADLDV